MLSSEEWWGILICVTLLTSSCDARPSFSSNINQAGNLMLHDICTQTPYGSRRYFLNEGQNGTVIAKNLDFNRISSLSARSFYSLASLYSTSNMPDPAMTRTCSIELTTCPSCSLRLEFKILNLPSCQSNASKCSGCDHLAIKENYYASPWIICGGNGLATWQRMNNQYHSVGRSLTINFVFSQSYEYAFLLEFASVVNTRLVKGRFGDQGYISSPHFPTVYPQDYSSQVQLRNTEAIEKQQSDNSSTGAIQITFEDFALGSASFIDIRDADDVRIQTLYSSMLRPPVLVIPGNEISIWFNANGGRASGYRINYQFINESIDSIEVPITDCGGIVDNNGGIITMSNMSIPDEPRLFDCIWLIKPTFESTIRTHISVRVEMFNDLDAGTNLEIRQGLTSQSPLAEALTQPVSLPAAGPEYLLPSDIGFYLRLRGRLSASFKLAIAYTVYGYIECYSVNDFICLNHRCISANLRCDGFNHCGDNSDEQTACEGVLAVEGGPQDPSWWASHTPVYYFPKRDYSGEFGATSFVLLLACVGIFAFIFSVIALLYRMSSHTTLIRERQARLDIIRATMANNDDEQEPETVEEPPCYEAPPDYAEIAKLAELYKEAGNQFEGGLRVLMPPTPTESLTSERRRNSKRYSGRHNLMTGSDSAVTTPSSSRTSTPARSRNATPHRNRRGRRSAASLASTVPIHLDTQLVLQSPSLIHNSPPPPYEIFPDSPFRILVQQVELQSTEPEVQSPMTDCGCPGACSCSTIIRRLSMDSMTPLIETTTSSSPDLSDRTLTPNESLFPLYLEARKKLVPVEKRYMLSGSQSEESVLRKRDVIKSEEEETHKLRVQEPMKSKSLDRATPLLGQLKKHAWNRSI